MYTTTYELPFLFSFLFSSFLDNIEGGKVASEVVKKGVGWVRRVRTLGNGATALASCVFVSTPNFHLSCI